MAFAKHACLALGLALLTGCVGYSVKLDYDHRTDFQAYKTFDWYEGSKKARGKTGPGYSPIMERRVRGAVERELTAKGFRMDKQGDPDFYVVYYPVFQNRHFRTSTVVGGGWRRPWGYGVATRFSEVHTYREGTIVIEIVDGRRHELVWQAAAVGALSGLDHPEDADEQITRAVRDTLDRFPPVRER